MKNILKYIPALGLALAFGACESDLETVTYSPENSKAAVLKSVDAAYVLDAQKSDQTVFTLEWSEPDMGYQAAVTNNVEIDLKGNNFATPVVAASLGKGGEYAFTHNDLNNLLMGLLEDRGMEIAANDFEIRIASSISASAQTLYSNTVSTNITPFVGERQYPQIWIVGTYCNWNHGQSQYLFSANDDENYAGMIYFDGKAADGWKLTPAGNWDNGEWGAPEAPEAEAPSMTLLTSGGGNISNYSHNSYYMEFNTETAELKVSQAYDSWGIVGGHSNWGNKNEDGSITPDTPMTLGSETDLTGATQYFLTATMDMAAGNTWKIRPDMKWENDKGPGNTAIEGDAADNGDGNFRVDDAGNYTIKWYFNKVSQRITVTKN